jgi:PST family polysaccharide transporter
MSFDADQPDAVQPSPAVRNTGLAGRVASGTVWMGGVTAASRLIGLASQFALMWLLQPDHFGTLGLVFTITMFATHLTYPGTDDVLLQKGKHFGRWASAGFWMSIACGIGGGVAMILLGLIVVNIAKAVGNPAYGSDTIINMILIYAIGAPLNAAATVAYVKLRHEMRFGKIAAVLMLEMLGQHSLMVLLAWNGFGAYSFAIPMPIIAAVRTTALWMIARPKITPRLGLHRWPHLATASGYVLGFRLLQTGWHHSDQIILGATYASKTINGHYMSAVQLTQQIVRVLCENLLAVLVPALAQIRDDRPRMEAAVAKASRMLTAMVVPLAALQILLAGPVIRAFFPDRWVGSIEIVQWLSFAPLVHAAAFPMMAMITATGRFKAAFLTAIVSLILFYAIVLPATRLGGASGTAMGVSIFYWVLAHLYSAAAFGSWRGIKVLHLAVYRALIAVCLAAGPSVALLYLLPAQTRWQQLAVIVVITPVLLAVYTLALRWIDPEALRLLLDRFFGAAGPIFRRVASVVRPRRGRAS